jgi:hypothetical protein
MEGLHLPQVEESGDIVCEATKTLLQKDNKHCKCKVKEQQEAMTQWITYKGKEDMSTPSPTTPPAMYQNLMCLMEQALTHPAARGS